MSEQQTPADDFELTPPGVEDFKEPKRREHNPAKVKAFLVAYSECGNVTEAARLANITRQSHYEWLSEVNGYAAAFEVAREMAADRLEAEARRRAVEGVDDPVFYKGRQITVERDGKYVPVVLKKYSDALLMFLMKGASPDKYRDRATIDQTISTSGPGGLTDEQLERIAQRGNASASGGGTATPEAGAEPEKPILP